MSGFQKWFDILIIAYFVVVFLLPWLNTAYRMINYMFLARKFNLTQKLQEIPFRKKFRDTSKYLEDYPEVQESYRKTLQAFKLNFIFWISGFFLLLIIVLLLYGMGILK